MKKILLAMAALLLSAMHISAQVVGTLNHSDTISTFYGRTALQEAYAKAVDGDIITLSAGAFDAVDIDKKLTIRGYGAALDSIHHYQVTSLMGDFELKKACTMEGIYHEGTMNHSAGDGRFVKCRFNEVSYSKTTNASITSTYIQCRIKTRIENKSSNNSYKNNKTAFINSIVYDPQGYYFDFYNCVVFYNKYGGTANVYNSSFANCFLCYLNSGDKTLDSSNTAFYCVALNGVDAFKDIYNPSNKVATGTSMFKSWSAYAEDGCYYELKDTEKSKYIGSDGTEIGIHGGSLPFSVVPTVPQIRQLKVPARATADGKLNIEVTVDMPD